MANHDMRKEASGAPIAGVGDIPSQYPAGYPTQIGQDPRGASGRPPGWMPGGETVPHTTAEHMAAAKGTTFDRTPAPGKGDPTDGKTWSQNGGSSYMPSPFKVGLPRLEDRPSTAIFRDPPITTLDDFTMSDIKSALRGHTLGMFLNSARLADAMTGNDRIASCLGSRVKGMLGLPFRVKPRSKRKDDPEAQKVSTTISRLWDQMCPRAQVAEFLQWAVMMGFAIAEVVWRVRKGMWVPTIRTWHPQLAYYRYDERAFYVTTMDGPIRVTPGDGKWILYAPHGDYRGWMHGVVRTCAEPWRYRTFAMRDWARHAEKHGMPWVLPRVPRESDAAEKQAFFASLTNLGSEPTIMCPVVDEHNRFDVDIKEAAHPAADVFEKLVERCDTLISCAMLGQNLTTEVQGGSYAAATVHGQVRQDFLEADAMTLSQCLTQQLLRPFCIYNFAGGTRTIPRIGWDTRPPTDKKMTAETLRDFAGAIYQLAQAGFPLSVHALAQQFGIPLREGAKDKLIPPPKKPFENASQMWASIPGGDVGAAITDVRTQQAYLARVMQEIQAAMKG
jgi:phage gp29-like protein